MRSLSRWFRRSPASPTWIDPAVLAPRLATQGDLLVIDVRGPDEFTGPLGHIAPAINLPMQDLPARLGDIAQDDRAVVVVCKTDHRSSIAARQLREAGARDVSVLRGGMQRWHELGLPVAD